LKTSIELARERSNESILRQEIVGAESMLRVVLNRPYQIPIGFVAMDSVKPVRHSIQTLLRYAQHHHPMLAQDSLNVVQGDLMVNMAHQEYFPDFKISVERVTQPMLGMNSWTVMAGISLPFAPWSLSKASARVQEAQADRSMRQSMQQSNKTMVEAGIRESFAKMRAYEEQVRSFEQTILPQSRQSLQSSLAEYQAGRTPYLMLLDAFRMNQDMRMEATMSRMKYEEAVASLQQQVGVVDVNEIPVQEIQR
jgi:cobalt-zinc-cadmium efflux system outer membrane protein